MIYCFDTHYFENKAQTACIGISNWEQQSPDIELSETIEGIEQYESGSFYKRELPCLTSIISTLSLDPKEDILVIDGFVVLDDQGQNGLGGHLYEHLQENIPVIGVAKNNYATIHTMKRELLRGVSDKPLFITSKGIDVDQAREYISQMHGEYRLPTILKLVDSNCRKV